MRASRHTIPETGFITTSMECTSCPLCGSSEIIDDSHRGERICTNCGTVIEEKKFDFSADRRAFTAEEIEKRRHNGDPINPLTEIAWMTEIKPTGNNVSADFNRIVDLNRRLPWNQKNLLIAFNAIKRVCASLTLPQYIAIDAAIYYRKMQKRNVLRGRSINGFVGACLYLACRVNKIPRSVNDICAEMPGTTARDIRICFTVIINELKIRLPRIDAIALLQRYIGRLAMSQEIACTAAQLIQMYRKNINMSGKDPKGIIAAAIYIACKNCEEIAPQSYIAEHCSVTEVTMRSRIKEFKALHLD